MFGGADLLQLLVIKDSCLSNTLFLPCIKVWFFFQILSFTQSKRYTYMFFAVWEVCIGQKTVPQVLSMAKGQSLRQSDILKTEGMVFFLYGLTKTGK